MTLVRVCNKPTSSTEICALAPILGTCSLMVISLLQIVNGESRYLYVKDFRCGVGCSNSELTVLGSKSY